MSITDSNHRSGETTAGGWQVDPQRSSVEFSVGNFWGLATVQGHFGDYHGRLDLSADPAIELTIDAAASTVALRHKTMWNLVTVKGAFTGVGGQGEVHADGSATGTITVDAASLDTKNKKRDEHLRSADFFDADNHPRVQFLSQSVEPQGETLKVRGRLSARDRSIPVELDAHIREAGGELEVEAATTAPHRELGMTWSPLRMIRPRARLVVKAHLIRDPRRLT